MKILMAGDVIGHSGRRAFRERTPRLRKEFGIDIVIVNGENSAGGKGITERSLEELYSAGADIVTSGNHVWDKKEVLGFIDREPFLIRPANYPEGAPGKGYCIYPFRSKNIGVMNLSGRTFMPALDCPFRKADELLGEFSGQCDIILLDFHGEATSEKVAMGWYLDGRIHAVIGTHTHIQTADERILPQGTAYITDVGMVGPIDSILGVKKEAVIGRFLTGMPAKFDVAEGRTVYSAVIIDIDDATGDVKEIKRLYTCDQ